jgi:cytidylate kinase
MPHIIAIDGPAGAGKSTIARALAAKLGYVYIDTGAMYRAVALWAIRGKISPDDAHKMEQLAHAADIDLPSPGVLLLNREDVSDAIRTPEVTAAASRVAAIAGVRAALVARQREMAKSANVVMEGRDIGTVVFPGARVKVFLDAGSSERVRRRAGDQPQVPQERLAEEIAQRDQRDRSRAESPLVQAPDAVYLDSTRLTPDEVVEQILKLVRERISNGKEH